MPNSFVLERENVRLATETRRLRFRLVERDQRIAELEHELELVEKADLHLYDFWNAYRDLVVNYAPLPIRLKEHIRPERKRTSD